MGTLYIQTTGNAQNSGSTDTDAATLSGSAATVAGSVVTLDGSPDLSGVVTSGSTQSTIFLADATNANTKIFWITAVDDVLKTVTVETAPTGVTSSVWRIGGRHVLTNASIEGALRAGDTAIFNDSPASAATTIWTFRNAGNSTSGFAKIKGKDGTRPVFTTTGNVDCVSMNALELCWVENIQVVQQGASSGNGVNMSGRAGVCFNVKVTQAKVYAISTAINNGSKIIANEISGGDTAAINASGNTLCVIGNYIHDVLTDGILLAANSHSCTILNNILDSCGGRGIYVSSTAWGAGSGVLISIVGNTVYGCGNSGLEVADADAPIVLMNNVFMNNGNAAGESNVEWVAGKAENASFHAWNILHNTSGADAPINFTVNAQVADSEIVGDPTFANAASGDFALLIGSPAINAGYPGQFLNGSKGYLDIGAVSGPTVISPPSAAAIAAQVMDLADGVETGITLRQAQRAILAGVAGKADGLATTTVHYRNPADTKNRITATVDGDGNRTAVTLDVS